MDDPGKKCDICEIRQLSSNGWIRYQDGLNFVVLRPKTKTSAQCRDACGHSCVIKAFVAWLTAVHVNAPVVTEERKNED